jgi:acyl-CoA thioesterase-1
MASILDTIRAEHDSPVDILVLGYRNVVQDGAVGLTTYGPDGLEQAKQATAYGNDALRQAADHGGATYLDTGISPRNTINGVACGAIVLIE